MLAKMSPACLSSAIMAAKEESSPIIIVLVFADVDSSPNDGLRVKPDAVIKEFVISLTCELPPPRRLLRAPYGFCPSCANRNELPTDGGPRDPKPEEPSERADAIPVMFDPVLLYPLMPDIVDIVDPDDSSVGVKARPKAKSSGCPGGKLDWRIPRGGCACGC